MLREIRLNQIMTHCIFVLLLLFSINPLIIAQSKPVKFNRFSTKDGLSQNKVLAIIQDDLGFIWLGTEDGLNRYDVYVFNIYKNIEVIMTGNFLISLLRLMLDYNYR